MSSGFFFSISLPKINFIILKTSFKELLTHILYLSHRVKCHIFLSWVVNNILVTCVNNCTLIVIAHQSIQNIVNITISYKGFRIKISENNIKMRLLAAEVWIAMLATLNSRYARLTISLWFISTKITQLFVILLQLRISISGLGSVEGVVVRGGGTREGVLSSFCV